MFSLCSLRGKAERDVSSPSDFSAFSLLLSCLSVFPLWNGNIKLPYALSQSLSIPFRWEIFRSLSLSLPLDFLPPPPSICLWFCPSPNLSPFLPPPPSSSSPSQIHLCLLSSLHVVAAIFSPYLEPDILSLSMILKRTPGRRLPELAWSPISSLPLSDTSPSVFEPAVTLLSLRNVLNRGHLNTWHWHCGAFFLLQSKEITCTYSCIINYYFTRDCGRIETTSHYPSVVSAIRVMLCECIYFFLRELNIYTACYFFCSAIYSVYILNRWRVIHFIHPI